MPAESRDIPIIMFIAHTGRAARLVGGLASVTGLGPYLVPAMS